jgi:HNH endonuclease
MYTERKLTCTEDYRRNLVLRFADKVEFGSSQDSCLLWTGYSSGGYGKIMLVNHAWTGSSSPAQAHVISYLLSVGTIPKGYDVAHSCNNKLCVNPRHLYLATRSENTQHAVRDGLQYSRLSDIEVSEIRRLWSTGQYTQAHIAELFCTDQQAVSLLVNGKTYKWVTA